MPNSLIPRSCLVALAFAAPFAFSRAASAAETCGDTVCPANWECKTGQEPCASLPCDGGDCAVPECEPTTYAYCSPLPCTDDSVCEDGMVCYTETRQECDTAPPCAGGDCPKTDVASCQDVTESGCVPQYFLPCEADADCGTGFTCVAEEDCSCGGSAPSSGGGSSGSAGSSGSSDPAPPAEKPAPDADAGAGDPAPDDPGATPDAGTSEPPPECVCTKTDRKSCSLKVVVCSVDEGCPAGWTCGDNPNRSCWASSDGTSGCSDDPEKICLPPYSDLLGRGSAVDDAGGTPLGTPEPPKGSGSPTGTPETGAGGSSSSGSSSHAANEDASESEENGGCAIGRAPSTAATTFGFAALALAGLFGARRRRRSHRD